jgi:hypothetical protein
MIGCAAAAAFSWTLLRMVALPRDLRSALAALGTLAVLSASWTVALFLAVPVFAIDATLFAAALALLVFTQAQPPRPLTLNGETSWERRAFAAACAVAAAALILHQVHFPDGGNDAFIIWNLRASWLFRAGSDFRSAFSPEILFWAHPDYPLLLPSLVARGFALAGRESRLVPAAVALLFCAGAVAVVVTGAPPRRRWLAGLALVTTPALVMLGATQQADVPVGVFAGAAVAILIAREPGDDRALAAAGAFASMALWTKNEGSLCLLLLGAAILLDERRLRAGIAFLAGALPLLALLAVFKLGYAPPNDLLHSMVPQRAFSPERWWTLGLLLLRRVVLLQAWGLHLAGLVLVLALAGGWTAPRLRWLSWVPAATIATHLCILLAQPHDLTFMFKVTIDRLLIQVWPAILLLLAVRGSWTRD